MPKLFNLQIRLQKLQNNCVMHNKDRCININCAKKFECFKELLLKQWTSIRVNCEFLFLFSIVSMELSGPSNK